MSQLPALSPPPHTPHPPTNFPHSPIRDFAITDSNAQLLGDFHRASAMAIPHSIVSRYATVWAESLEGALNGYQSWAILCRYRCRLLLADIPNGLDINAEFLEAPTAVGSRISARSHSLEEIWVSITLGNNTERSKQHGRRPMSSVVKEPVPSRSGDQSAKP